MSRELLNVDFKGRRYINYFYTPSPTKVKFTQLLIGTIIKEPGRATEYGH